MRYLVLAASQLNRWSRRKIQDCWSYRSDAGMPAFQPVDRVDRYPAPSSGRNFSDVMSVVGLTPDAYKIAASG
ncbi:MAG: hypothetical protein V2I50_07205 [Desulfuromusa sp.]|jgi:hypothetical protein|nr:hypothetical protein [Desulfuromusa sp.]